MMRLRNGSLFLSNFDALACSGVQLLQDPFRIGQPGCGFRLVPAEGRGGIHRSGSHERKTLTLWGSCVIGGKP